MAEWRRYFLFSPILLALALPAWAEEKPFRFTENNKGTLTLLDGAQPVLVYNHGVQLKAGAPKNYQRCSYVHPIYGLDGEVLTDDFPKDHYHHRGLFWAWPHVRLDGKEYDLWALRGMRQQFERWGERKADKDGAILGVENGWYIGEKRVAREEVRLRVGPARNDERVIDVELQVTALDEPVTLWGAAGKSYGGMSLRFAPRKETVIITAEGTQKKDLNLANLTWADFAARFEGGKNPSGIALMVDPGHPDFPPTWITRHYGFLGVGWPGIKPMDLKLGSPTTLKYRLLIHRGWGDRDKMQRAYQVYTSALGNKK